MPWVLPKAPSWDSRLGSWIARAGNFPFQQLARCPVHHGIGRRVADGNVLLQPSGCLQCACDRPCSFATVRLRNTMNLTTTFHDARIGNQPAAGATRVPAPGAVRLPCQGGGPGAESLRAGWPWCARRSSRSHALRLRQVPCLASAVSCTAPEQRADRPVARVGAGWRLYG